MAENTKIEWCDHTFNPWTGCTKVSPGCDHCYAEGWAKRSGAVKWGAGEPRRRTTPANWRKPLQWEAGHSDFMTLHNRRQRVFCSSLADVFDNAVPAQWRVDLFNLIVATPHLDWLLLTKRVGNVAPMLRDMGPAGLPSNVWLGATVVNQEEADRDIPKLLAVPARVRFLSIEPMLGPVDLSPWLQRCDHGSRPGPDGVGGVMCTECGGAGNGCHRLHWVICGGESGPGARPMQAAWAQSLRDQCAAAGVPFLFKQWGEWLPIDQQAEEFTNRLYRSNRKAELHQDQGALDESYGRTCTVPYGVVHADGSFHELLAPMAFLQGTGAMTTFKVGKKAAGRLLDGIEHNGFPGVR